MQSLTLQKMLHRLPLNAEIRCGVPDHLYSSSTGLVAMLRWVGQYQPRIQDLAKGGGGGRFYWRGGTLTMNACEARDEYEKRGGGGGGGCSLLQVRYEKWGGGGCLPYDDLYLGLCARA